MRTKDLIFYALTTVYVLVFLVMTGRDSFALPYSVAGNCYPDTASALVGFQAQFPQVQGTSIVNLTTSSISTAGLITFVTQTRLLTTATWTTNPSSTVQLGTCAANFAASSVAVTESAVLAADLNIQSAVQQIQINTASEVAAVSSVNAHITNIDNAISSVVATQALSTARYPVQDYLIPIAVTLLWGLGFSAGLKR